MACCTLLTLAAPAGAADGCQGVSAQERSGTLTVRPDTVSPGPSFLQQAWTCVHGRLLADRALSDAVIELPASPQNVSTALSMADVEGRRTVRIQGAPTAVLGLRMLEAWRPVSNSDAMGLSLPRNALEVPVPAELARLMREGIVRNHGDRDLVAPPDLVVDGQVYQLAMWPKNAYLKAELVANSEQELLAAWDGPELPSQQTALLAQGFFRHDWADASVRIQAAERADEGKRRLRMRLLGTPPKYGVKSGARLVVAGLPAFLKERGEYVVLPDRDAVVFLPHAPPTSVALTQSVALLDIKSDNVAVRLDKVRVSGFRGLAVLLGGNESMVTDCEFSALGMTAIRMTGDGSKIRNSRFVDIGATAIELAAGSRSELRPGRAEIADSIVRNFGRRVWSSVPGIRVEGVANDVLRNEVSEGPHAGIFYFGNDHRIIDNEVHHVALRTGDVGAIYTGRDLAGRGHLVERNFVHHLHGHGSYGATAFYVDDQSSGVTIRDNVVFDADRGVLIGGGRDNVVTRNVFERVQECAEIDARGLTWQRNAWKSDGALVQKLREVPHDGDRFLARYPKMRDLLTDRPGVPVGNTVVENVGTDCKWRLAREAVANGEFRMNLNLPELPLRNGTAARPLGNPSRADLQIDWTRALQRKQ